MVMFYDTLQLHRATSRREISQEISKEVASYISPGESMKMVMALADALGYEIRRVTKDYEAIKKGK